MRKRWNYTRKRADYKGTIRFPLTDDQRLLGPRDSYREYDNLVRNAANRGNEKQKKTLEHLWWLSTHHREPTATAPRELMHTVVVLKLILALSERLWINKRSNASTCSGTPINLLLLLHLGEKLKASHEHTEVASHVCLVSASNPELTPLPKGSPDGDGHLIPFDKTSSKP